MWGSLAALHKGAKFRGSRSQQKDTVEVWAGWKEALTPLRHIVEGRAGSQRDLRRHTDM